MPPSKSGIADYSAALAEELSKRTDLTVFGSEPKNFDPSRFDISLYQLGNNPYHSFVYEGALRHPGVVVMHESNLHHLITDLTIRRGDWDAYGEECAFNGGTEARDFALRVRNLEVGPDYDGLPMTKRLLRHSRGVVAHPRPLSRSQAQASTTRSRAHRPPFRSRGLTWEPRARPPR